MLIEIRVNGLPIARYTLPRCTEDTLTETLAGTTVTLREQEMCVENAFGKLEYRLDDSVYWTHPHVGRVAVNGKVFTLGNTLIRILPFRRQVFYLADRVVFDVDRYTVNRYGTSDRFSFVVGSMHIFVIDRRTKTLVKAFSREREVTVNLEKEIMVS